MSSVAYCRRVCRRSRSSFRFAFRLLPPVKRDAMHALYAFLRASDDLADEPGVADAKRVALARWRERLDAALNGTYSHRCHAALHHTVRTFGIPPAYLHAVLDGCDTDLEPVKFQSFEQLRVYCYRVASAVGLTCVRIWGVQSWATIDWAESFAVSAGYAYQLTNILRDLGEDRNRGRVYLPADELAQFDCPPEAWDHPDRRFDELMAFQVARARAYYQQSEPLAGLLSAEGRAIFTLMTAAYRQLLERVAAAGPGVLTRRVRLPWWRKAALAGRAWGYQWTG